MKLVAGSLNREGAILLDTMLSHLVELLATGYWEC